jgi:CRISPR locus-related DNA-binding protein
VKYSIAISGFQSELIIKPFLRVRNPIDELILIVTNNSKSLETADAVKKLLAFNNVECTLLSVSDIFNFFEVLVNLEILLERKGRPKWINVSAGPGIAISSLTFFSITHNIPVVFYNRESDKTSMVDISKSKDLFRNAKKNLNILKLIEENPLSLGEISEKLGLSKPTISRRISLLREAYLVEPVVKNRKMTVKITETSRKLLEKQDFF